MEPPHISLAAETLFTLGPLRFTNSMLMMFIAMIAVFLFLRSVGAKAKLVPTGRMQNLGEAVVEGLLGLVEGVAGKDLGRRIFRLIASLFLFILVANWMALLPGVGTIGYCKPETHAEQEAHGAAGAAPKAGEHAAEPAASKEKVQQAQGWFTGDVCHEGNEFVPFFRAANADLNMTLAMALIAITLVQAVGIRFHGIGGYLKELATPWWLFPVHVISELSRILSLSARLFGNIFGGEVFVVVIFFLFPLVLPLIPLGLEVFFGFIQAVLFSVLTLVYLSMAAAGHGSHEDEHDDSMAEMAARGAAAHGGD
jgi:F-type H+-transporting ATPase subunit a